MSFFWHVFLVAAAYAQQSCVTIQVTRPGDGVTFPKPGDTVSIQYTGTLTNGQKFDSSRDRGKEFSTQIGVGNVIQGWDTGVPQMSLGERANLHISAACGYGAQGAPPAIPPNADLIFDVELLGINGQRASPAVLAGQGQASPAPAQSAVAQAQPSATAQATVTLPACRPHSCGKAMSSGPTSLVPVCACDASCLTATSPLPCCPSFNEICQNPAPANAAPVQAAVSAAAAFAPKAMQPPQPNLPECTFSSCGNAISWDPSGLSAPVCLCNPLCQTMKDTPGILPCCPKLQQVCLDPYRSPSPHPPPPAPVTPVSMLRSPPAQTTVQAAVQAPVAQAMAQASIQAAFQAPAPAGPPAGKGKGKAAQQAAVAAQAPVSTSDCALGATKWDEQNNCDKKRWAVKSGKCKKVCPATNSQLGVKYWDKGDAGKSACEAAANACNYPKS